MQSLNHFLRDYFGFTRIEARGFWLLTIVMSGLIALNFCLPLFDFSPRGLSKTEREHLEAFASRLSTPTAGYSPETAQMPIGERFLFNPNEASAQDFERLGIPAHFVKSITRYREKGGKFRKKADLKKIYHFPQDLYTSLEPYIDLPTEGYKKYAKTPYKKREKAGEYKNTYKKPAIQPFDLNIADTATLSQVRGIGAKTAQAIVEYREKLGGFVRLEQLQEVYILKNRPEVATELTQYARLQSPAKKILINEISAEELQKHPYFRKIAKSIVGYRTKAGKFATPEDLQKMKIITPEIWENIKDYLAF